jgi:hypothetical protein
MWEVLQNACVILLENKQPINQSINHWKQLARFEMAGVPPVCISHDVLSDWCGLQCLQVSQYLRSHNGSSFKWKDYSPLVFQRLRQLFGIDNMDYLLSLTGDRYTLPFHSALPSHLA